MRNRHAITAARIMEVLQIDEAGVISFKQKNHLHKRGDLPRIRLDDDRFYTRIDLKRVDLLAAAWVLQSGDFPEWPLRQKRFSMFDFRIGNLTRAARRVYHE